MAALHIPWEGCLCTDTAWRHRRRNLPPDWPAWRWQRLSSYLLVQQLALIMSLQETRRFCMSFINNVYWNSTWGCLEEDDFLGLCQHDCAQGTHSFRGDVHSWLSVQSWQNCVLNVAESSAGQLESETSFQTLGVKILDLFSLLKNTKHTRLMHPTPK